MFTALFDFPYSVGPQFVQALLDAGGRARLDAAFGDPPVTTEQVLHPERFLAGERAAPVGEPPADAAVIDEGELGELGLILVLDTAGGHDAALRAAAGWGGDHYVAWSKGRRTCVRWVIAMDTPMDTAELVAALRPWSAANRTATVGGTDPVTVTNCA